MRCPHCERLLDTPALISAGECGCRHRGGWEHGDIILNPATNSLLRGEYNRYSKQVEWYEMVPIGQDHSRTPDGAILLCRVVDGKRLPVTDIGDGELLTVRPVA